MIRKSYLAGVITIAIALLAPLGALQLSARKKAAQAGSNAELLRVREHVWRTWGAGDTKTLAQLVTPETIVMSGSNPTWEHQSDVLRNSAEFHAKGGRIVRLEFPRTEIQHFGD